MFKYSLHDSLVNDIQYDDIEQKITINIELANWSQDNYNKNQLEMLNAVIEFCITGGMFTPVDSKHFLDSSKLTNPLNGYSGI